MSAKTAEEFERAEAETLYIVRYWFHYNGLSEIPEWALAKLRQCCETTAGGVEDSGSECLEASEFDGRGDCVGTLRK